MANVYKAAGFYVDVCNNSIDNPITNLKLNKLLYFAKGCHLARTGKSLFPETIEAWECRPVTPAVYQRYRICGHGVRFEAQETITTPVVERIRQIYRKRTSEYDTSTGHSVEHYVRCRAKGIPMETMRRAVVCADSCRYEIAH